jgi:hypothetical protein
MAEAGKPKPLGRPSATRPPDLCQFKVQCLESEVVGLADRIRNQSDDGTIAQRRMPVDPRTDPLGLDVALKRQQSPGAQQPVGFCCRQRVASQRHQFS